MLNLKKYAFRFIYPLLVIIIEAVLFAANFTPKTFLIGWDNIMPELNFKLNYLRAITSVWQDYRGLGTLDGMAHAANLVHTFYINLLSLVLPQNVLRYSYIHLTHLVGGLAFYFLFTKLLKNKNAAFIGALFYLFNIGVIQMYFAPLEVFATHFAALPLMGLAILNAFEKKNKLSLFLLGAASFLTSPQAFVPTVFIAYGVFAASLLLFSVGKTSIKRLILVAAILFITNAFWFLPFTYSAINKSAEIQNTRINEFSSEEIYYRNKARGTFLDTITLKGFMLDTIEYDTFKEQNFYFMSKWLAYLKSVPMEILSYAFAVFMIFGSFLVIRFRLKSLYPLLATNIISFVFLANNTPLLSNLNDLLRFAFPIFGEAFRFPFTKFITLFAFSYAILMGLGVSYAIKILVNLIQKVIKNENFLKALYPVLIAGVSFLILISALPAFQGNFTSPFLRLSVPKAYFETINYFNNQNSEARVLTFPLDSFWNWEYRSWGHRGSGFLWYAIPQEILTRAFDPWSNDNEQLFNQFQSAYLKGDINQFDLLLKKYNVNYIMIDKSVLNTLTPKPIDYTKIEQFLNKSSYLKKDKDFGMISIYKGENKIETVSELPKNTLSVYPDTTQTNRDNLIDEAGNYYLGDKKSNDITFPFPSLATLKLPKDNQFTWDYKNGSVTLNSLIKSADISGKSLVLPNLFENEFLIPVKVTVNQNTITLKPVYPKVVVNGNDVTFDTVPIIITTSIVNNPKSIVFKDTNTTLNVNSKNMDAFILNNFTNTIEVSDGPNTEYFELDTTKIDKSPFIVKLPDTTINSFSVSFPVFDTDLGKSNYLENKDYKIAKPSETLKKAKTQASYSTGKNQVELTSVNSSISLDIYLQPQFHAASYVAIADVNNVSGLPANFYVDDPWASRAVLETRFDNGKNIAVVSGTDDFSKGYGYHIGAKSVGTENSTIDINKIIIAPIPQDTLENIRLVPNSMLDGVTKVSEIPTSSKRISNFLYVASPQKEGILTLSQSFDSGWKAYAPKFKIQNSKFKNFLFEAFPFIFGNEVKTHVKVNGWENGWKIDNKTMEQSSNKTIIITFLPQYWGFAGFILLLASVTVIPFLRLLKFEQKLDKYFYQKSEVFKNKISVLRARQ